MVLVGKKVVERHCCEHEDLEQLKELLNKYKKYPLYMLWACNSNVTHESLPIMGSIGYANPVKEFIERKFVGEDKCVSHKVHSIHGSDPEIWDVVLVSAVMKEQWRSLCLSAVKNDSKFGGVYLFPHVAPRLVVAVAKSQSVIIDDSAVNIFVTFSGVLGLRIIAVYQENILFSKEVEHPADASDEYMCGIIENEAADILIYLKNYLGAKEEVKKIFTLLLPEALAERCGKSEFGFDQQNILYGYAQEDSEEGNPIDAMLCQYFVRIPQEAAHHVGFSRVARVQRARDVIIIPFVIAAIVMASITGMRLLNLNQLEDQIATEHSEYSRSAALFRELRSKFQDISKFSQFTDFISISNALDEEHQAPLSILKHVNELSNIPDVALDYVKWKRLDSATQSLAEVELLVRYVQEGEEVQDGIDNFKSLIDDYNSRLPRQFYADYVIDRYRSKARAGKVIIHATMQVKERVVE